MEKEEQRLIRISVRSLVEFVMRSGDLDNRRTAGAKKEAMQAGSRLHRKLQKRMGSSYRSEVSLKHRVREDRYTVLVEGRADGIITEPAGAVVDEIKCIYMDVGRLEAPEPVHLAQALCYGYFYSHDNGLDSIGVQVTYCNIETEEIRRFREERTFQDLTQWFQGLIHEYMKWSRYLYHHGMRRQECLKELPFPYPYREGQKELAVDVYRSIARKRNLFIQAPTGVGKTLSTIYPSLKAMGEGHGEKLFYLTARTVTRSVAEEAFAILRREGGLYFNTVTITAKEKLCILERPDCNPQSCPRARGHYDRVNDGVYEILGAVDGITREAVLEYARRHQVCPFEFCLDISNWVDGIICDYNYVFDPNVRLKRYFSEGEPGHGYLFLVDEAHNLVPRARQMYSASLVKEDVLAVSRILKRQTGAGRLLPKLDQCNKKLLELKRGYGSGVIEGAKYREVLGGSYELLPEVNLLALNLMSMFGELEQFMNENVEFADRDKVLEFYFSVRDFLFVHDRVDDRYRIYARLLPEGRFMVKLLCVNPSANLRECLARGDSTVFFSATLLPIRYYKELLSGSQEEYAVYAKSPFPRENRLVLAAGDVSSRYSRRGRHEYEKIVDYICRIVEGKKGNYMVFCPSYQYLHEIGELLGERETGFTWMAQKNRMTEEEREGFLEAFEEERDRSLAALCVMGGIFSEGIDLKEDRLIGAVIIGTGLPQVNAEQEILRDYFDSQGGKGFDYAYQYPGMNKVMQAAGRVIRTGRDRGVIALLDDRFLGAECVSLFPREWGEYTVVSRHNVEQAVKAFWDRSE